MAVRGHIPPDLGVRVTQAHTAAIRSSGNLGETIPTGEAARRLGVSATWVRHLVGCGQLTAIRTPLGLLINEESVAALQKKRDVRGGGGRG